MKLLEKIQSYFTNEKVKELEERLKKVEDNSTTAVCKDPYRACVAEIKLISKTIYNVSLGSVTVVLNDGSVLEGNGLSQEKYLEIQNCTDRSCLIALLSPPKEKSKGSSNHDIEEQEVRETISSIVDVLKERDEFDVIGDKVFLKGVKSIELPSSLVAEFIRLTVKEKAELHYAELESNFDFLENVQQEYDSLLMFSYKLLTSPRKENIGQVLTFIKHNDIKLSPLGNIIGYRRVNKWKSEKAVKNIKFRDFLESAILKVKAQKKGAKNYWVHLNEETNEYYVSLHQYSENNDLGNLYYLYNSVRIIEEPSKQLYTSQHSSGKYTFAIGDIYKSEDNDIDLDANVCHSGGLHFASCNYDYSGYGTVPVVVLVNPAKAITIPTYEIAKGRTTEMKIACINPNEHGEHIDINLIAKADEEFEEYTIEELKNVLQTKSFKYLSVEDETCALTMQEVLNISEILSNRVVLV